MYSGAAAAAAAPPHWPHSVIITVLLLFLVDGGLLVPGSGHTAPAGDSLVPCPRHDEAQIPDYNSAAPHPYTLYIAEGMCEV